MEWVTIPFSRGSSRPRDHTHVSCIGKWVLYHCTTWEAPLKIEPTNQSSHSIPQAHPESMEKARGQPAFPFSPPLFGLPYFLRHNNIKIKQINNLIIGLYISLTLNKKLEMIQFSEKGMSRAERGHKLGLLPQTVSQVMNAKEKFSKQIKKASRLNTQMV